MAVMASIRRNQETAFTNSGSGLNVVALMILIGALVIGAGLSAITGNVVPVIAFGIAGVLLMPAPRIAQQWERAIVLRFGRYVGLRGPGLFWIVPFVDRVSSTIDQRTIATGFAAEQTLTADTVPVNVDAVLFWMVHDAEKAALEVQDYGRAVAWASQTALRDIIGRTTLAELLRGRAQIEEDLQKLIDERSVPWGVTVSSVEMRDIVIPARCRMRCHDRRKLSARNRRASSSARRSLRSPIRSPRPRSRTTTTRPPCTCAR